MSRTPSRPRRAKGTDRLGTASKPCVFISSDGFSQFLLTFVLQTWAGGSEKRGTGHVGEIDFVPESDLFLRQKRHPQSDKRSANGINGTD